MSTTEASRSAGHGVGNLSARQKACLCIIARKAWERSTFGLPGATYFDGWRRNQVQLVTGKNGLSECEQSDYKRLEAHFLQLAGEDGKAFEAQLAAETEPKRRAEAVLLQNIEEARDVGIDARYVERICKERFKKQVMEASAEEIWKLIYTVRNRAIARRAEGELTTDNTDNHG